MRLRQPAASHVALLLLVPLASAAGLHDVEAFAAAAVCELDVNGPDPCARWSRMQPASERSDAFDVVATPDGSLVVSVGIAVDPGVAAAYAVAYATDDGSPQWTSRIESTFRNDVAYAAAVDPAGARIYAAGERWSRHPQLDWPGDILVYALDPADGALLWWHQHGGSADDYDLARRLVVPSDGAAVFVSGVVEGAAARRDIYVAAHHPATGARLWSFEYDSAVHMDDNEVALALSEDDATVFSAGYSWHPGATIRYVAFANDAATGQLLWAHESAFEGAPRAMAVVPDGPVVLVGNGGMWALDPADGSERWRRADLRGIHLEATKVGILLLDENDPLGLHLTLVDPASGATVWRRDVPLDGDVGAATLAPDGRTFFVGGRLVHAFSIGDREGEHLWSAEFKEPDTDAIARALAVAPGGREIYAAGEAEGGTMITQAFARERIAGPIARVDDAIGLT